MRGNDSFRVFEEVLLVAKSNQVDMLLLAGDLFHDNKPSRSTVVKTMRLLRAACLSPGGAIRLAVRSDPALVNYMDPTIAVSLPVFVIHGNHDDPTGAADLGALSALDILSEAGLVTYFGKTLNSKRISISPILLQKDRTALALYGLGNIRDELLHQTWEKERNVKWLSPMANPADRDRQRHLPDSDTGGDDDLRWFNLLVLHQNRVTRGASKGISENLLPRWLDYVVWGHEHDSLPDLTLTAPPVVQPGSTVATSLSAGESKPKHAILLEVYRGKLKHRPVPLYTVRNFQFDDVALSEQSEVSETDPASIVKYLEATVKEMATDLETEFDKKLAAFQNGTFKQVANGVRYPSPDIYINLLKSSVRQPLVRLRVEITGNWEVPNPQRFGQSFVGRVANAAGILLFYRSKRRLLKKTKTFMQGYSGQKEGEGNEGDEDEDGVMLSQNGAEQRDVVQIPKLVQYYLYHSKAGGSGLKFLELDRLTGAVDHFVNKMETKAISDYVSAYMKIQQEESLKEAEKNTNGLDEDKLLEKFKSSATEAAKRVLPDTAAKAAAAKSQDRNDSMDVEKEADKIEKVTANNDINQDGCGMDVGNDSKKDNDENHFDDVEKQLDDVHALLTSNTKLAAALQQHKPPSENGDSPSSEDEDADEIMPARRTGTTRARGTRARGTRGRGRGRGRARARGIDSYLSTSRRESQMEARPAARRVTRRTKAVVEDSDDEVQVVGDSDEEEEYIPVPSSRKRRGGQAGGAPSQRVRTEPQAAAASASASASASRRSAFSSRARTRRNTATINVDEESGDDAM